MCTDCVVPENRHAHPMEGHWKFRGGGGPQQPKFIRESMKLNWKFLGEGGYRYFLEPHIPNQTENLECWFFWREENQRTWRKTVGARERTNNKLNPHVTPGWGIKPGPHWWEASEITTAPSLLSGNTTQCPSQVLNPDHLPWGPVH